MMQLLLLLSLLPPSFSRIQPPLLTLPLRHAMLTYFPSMQWLIQPPNWSWWVPEELLPLPLPHNGLPGRDHSNTITSILPFFSNYSRSNWHSCTIDDALPIDHGILPDLQAFMALSFLHHRHPPSFFRIRQVIDRTTMPLPFSTALLEGHDSLPNFLHILLSPRTFAAPPSPLLPTKAELPHDLCFPLLYLA